MQSSAAVVSFPSTGGVDVSIPTLDPATTTDWRDTASAAIGMPLGLEVGNSSLIIDALEMARIPPLTSVTHRRGDANIE